MALTNSNAEVAELRSDEPPARGQIVTRRIQPGASSTTENGLAFDPLAGGTTTVAVTGPPGVVTMSATGVRHLAVGTRAISLPTFLHVGAGLQSVTAATVDGPQHSGVAVTVTTADANLVRVSPNATTPGTDSITVHVPPGQTSAPFFVQGIENSVGSAAITVSSPGYASRTATVTVAPIAVQIGGLDPSLTTDAVDDADWWIEVGIPNADDSALAVVQTVRAGGPDFFVTVSSTTAVGTLKSDEPPAAGATVTKQIRTAVHHTQAAVSGTAYGLAFDPREAGTTIVTVTGPPGVGTTGLGVRTVNVVP